MEKIQGKPVLYRQAKTVLTMHSHFKFKKLSTGPVMNLGDACVYSCLYCYVGCVVLKFIFGLLGARNHEDVVIRRKDALLTLKRQLAANREKEKFHVVYSSSLVDIAATMGLLRETATACTMILEATVWDRRCPKAQGAGEGKRRAQKDAGGELAGKSGIEDHKRKKILSPAHKRQAVTLLVTQERYSVRRACRYLHLHPRTYRYGKDTKPSIRS